jgi:hypothetical protein
VSQARPTALDHAEAATLITEVAAR